MKNDQPLKYSYIGYFISLIVLMNRIIISKFYNFRKYVTKDTSKCEKGKRTLFFLGYKSVTRMGKGRFEAMTYLSFVPRSQSFG